MKDRRFSPPFSESFGEVWKYFSQTNSDISEALLMKTSPYPSCMVRGVSFITRGRG